MVFKNLHDIRVDNDISQQTIAAVLNVAQNTYSQYENGVIPIPVEAIIKLADYYGTSTDYLLDRTNDKTPK